MEKIELCVEQHAGTSLTRDWVAVFGMAGGTIGRGGQNKLVLPDPDADVARVHAMVRLESDGAHIANLCERRSMHVDQRELRSGDEVALRPGAVVGIGPYLLRARLPKGSAAAPSRDGLSASNATAVTVSAAVLDLPNPWADIPQQSGEPAVDAQDNPFAMLGRVESPRARVSAAPIAPLPVATSVKHAPVAAPLAVPAPRPLAEVAPASPPAPSPLASATPVQTPAIPEDFDPFAPDLRQQLSRAGDPWAGAGAGLSLAEVAPQRHDALLQDLGREPVAPSGGMNDARHSGLPQALDPREELDPLRLFIVEGLGAARPEPSVALARGNELGQVFPLPRGVAPVPAVAAAPLHEPPPAATFADLAAVPAPPPATTQIAPDPVAARPAEPAPPAATAADLQALVQAFMAGAGIAPHRAAPDLSPAFMQAFGEVLRVALQGTIELLAARAEIKKELRAGMTIIASGANNPLKFLPTAEGVLLQMTGQHFPGFMQPVPAMQEAYRDLRVHQVALLAGISAAYSEALTRFDPAEIEQRIAGTGGLLARLSAHRRKAALWDLYSQDYLSLRRHAEDDLVAFSGKTFVEAYEAAALAAGGTR